MVTAPSHDAGTLLRRRAHRAGVLPETRLVRPRGMRVGVRWHYAHASNTNHACRSRDTGTDTEYAGVGHGDAIDRAVRDPEFVTCLLAQHRPTSAAQD